MTDHKFLKACIPAAALLAVIPVISCEVGLGASVDTQPPAVSVTYPPANAVIRGTFTLAGECSDDKSLSSVTVTLTDTDTKTVYPSFTADLAKDKQSWSLSLNNAVSDGTGYNGWQYPDGAYKAAIYATDASGRTSGTASLSFQIDNTAPLFIMKSPGSSVITNPTAYGTIFRINGSISEEHTVADMAVSIFNASGAAVASTDTSPYTMQNIITAGGTSETIAQYLASDPASALSRRYTDIYGTDVSAKETRSYYCTVRLTDSAKAYTTPSKTENTTTGNTTDIFYFSDDVSSLTADYDVDALRNIINGTVSNAKRADIVASLAGCAASKAAFSLNPDKSPRYTISSLKFTGTEITSNEAVAMQKIIVAALAGLNDDYIEPSTLKVYQFGPYSDTEYEALNVSAVYSDPASYYASAGDSIKNILTNSEASYESSRASAPSAETYNYQVSLSDSIQANAYYLIAVAGEDTTGETIVPESGCRFGFVGKVTSEPPKLTLGAEESASYTNIANLGIVNSSDLGFSGTAFSTSAKIASVTYSVAVTDESTSSAVAGSPFTGTAAADDGSFDEASETWNCIISGAPGFIAAPDGSEYLYTVTFTVKDTNNNTSSNVSRIIHVDKIAPVTSVTVTPTVNGCTYGTASVTSTASDTNMKTLVLTASDTETHTSPVTVFTSSSYPVTTGIDTSAYSGTLTLTLAAADKAGNTGTSSVSYIIDTTPPTVTLPDAQTGWLTAATQTFTVSANDSGTGVSKVTYKIGTGGTEHAMAVSNASGSEYSSTLSLNEGTNDIYVYAADIAGNRTTAEYRYTYKIDTKAPVLSGLKGIDSSGASLSDVTESVITGGIYAVITSADTVSGTNKIWISSSADKGGAVLADTLTITNSNSPLTDAWTLGSKTLQIPASAFKTGGTWNDGPHTFYIHAEDTAGNEAVSSALTITADTTKPVLTVANLADNAVYTESSVTGIKAGTPTYTVSGTWSDATSGTKTLQYSTDGTNWNTVSGTTEAAGVTLNWTAPLAVSESSGNTISFRAKDAYGNVSDVVSRSGITFDFSVPVITLNACASPAAENFTVTGSVSDALAMNTSSSPYGLEITASKDGTDATTSLGTIKYTTDTNGKSVTFSVPVTASDTNNGRWIFTVNAEDKAGRDAAAVSSGTVIIDTIAPVLVTGNDSYPVTVDGKTYSADSWFKTMSIPFTGYYTENGSGISSLYYWLNKTQSSELNSATGTFSTASATGKACKYSAVISGFSAGTNTVVIEAVDNAGHISSPQEYTIKIDMTAPTITPSSLTSKLTNLTSAITFTGTAADETNGSGVKSIEVTVNGNKIAATTKETDKSAIVGTTEWTLTIDKDVLDKLGTANASGVCAVTATVTDKAGNATQAQIGSLMIDTTAPTAAIKSPSAATVNGTIDITGSVTEENTPKSIALYYATNPDTSLSKWTLFKMITTDSGTGDVNHTYGASVSDIYAWTLAGFDFNTASGAKYKTEGTGTVYVLPVAYDDAGNCNINTAAVSSPDYKTYSVDMNSDRPIIKIADLAANPGVLKNGTNATISGTITDDDADDEVVPVFLASHVQITSASLSGSDISATLNGVTGTVTFTGTATGDVTAWTNTTYGTTTLDKATGEWTYTPADTGDGSKDVYFFVSDNKNTSFYTGQGSTELFRPYVQFKSAAKSSNDSVITYRSDSISPRFSAVTVNYGSTTGASDATGVSLSASLTVGGTVRRYVKFVAGAYDENNIAKMTLKAVASDGTVIKDPATTYTTAFTETPGYTAGSKTYTLYTWTTGDVDLSTFATGAVTVTVTTYDTCGLSNISTNTFTLDNKGPSITVSSPSASDEVTGTVTLSGISTDNGGSTTETTQFTIPTTAQVAAGYTDEQLASNLTWSGSLASGKSAGIWGFTFDGSANSKLETYDGGSYSVESNGIYTIPVYLKSTDALGNCTIYKHSLKHNPDADKPVTAILYPTDADYDSGKTYVTLGGTIRLNGSVTIPSGTTSVSAVYIQIADSTGTFSSDDKTKASGTYGCTVVDYSGAGITAGWTASMTQDAWWGIAATRTASTWYINLNSNGKMDPSSGTNNIMLRACAVNADGKVGAWSSAYSVHIDKSAPTASAVVNQYSVSGSSVVGATPTAGQSYTSGMYLKGSWYLVVTVSDESGIVTDTSNANTLSVLENGTALTRGSGYYLSGEFTKDSKKGYYIYIPVSTTSGTVTYTVKATDTDGSGAHTIEPTFTLKIDNTAPTLSSFKGNDAAITAATAIQNSNYVYTVSGTVTDNDGGSGFACAAFYFYRSADNAKITGNKCIFDPMLTSTDNAEGKRPLLTSLANDTVADGINLYGVTLTVEQTSTTTLKVTDTLNSHIRQGGLIKIGGVYHKIETLSGSTITLDSETSDTLSTTAFFPYAQVADNTSTETRTSDLSAGSFTIKNDDGDGMPETVTQTGYTWDWNATIYSNNMPDGPVTIVCVVFDKAGNITGTSVSTRITNNAPRLAKVHFGTDLNGNGSYSSDEFTTCDIRTKTGSYSSAATVSTADYADSAFVIKDTLAVVPEFTGGNGTIGMVYSRSATGTTAVAGTVQNADTSVSTSGFTKESADTLYAYTLANTIVSPSTDGSDDGTGKGMSFTFWDSTEETTQGTDSLNCVLYVNDFTVQIHDVTKPTTTVSPFYWTSATDSSVYTTLGGTAGVNGHIELPEDLDTTTFPQTSGEYDTDPKVSGYIRIQGTASDNTRLRTISVSLADFTITPYSTYTAAGVKQGSSSADYLAVYVPSQRGWVVSTPSDGAAADLAADGWTFSVTDASGPTQSGHSVTWELDIDTSRITNIAGLDKIITATATDKGDLTPETAGTLRVDVVPYVTSVKTSLYSKNSSNWSVFTRTSTGHYSVRESESIVINGYNFATKNKPTVTLNSQTLTPSAYTATAVTADIGTAAASGALALTVNNGTSDIDALNNVNTNSKAYNMQPNGVNNDLLTDDLTFDVWQFKTIAKPTVSALKAPTVKVGPTGQIGASFSNFLFFNMPGYRSTGETKGSGAWCTQTPFTLGYNGCGDNTFAFDSNGYTYGAVQYQTNNSQAMSGYFHFFFATANQVSAMSVDHGYYLPGGSSRLEPNATNLLSGPNALWNNTEWSTNLYRITSPAIVPVASSTTSVTVHMAYADRTTHQIRYRQGIVNPATRTFADGGSLRDIYATNIFSPNYDYTGQTEPINDSTNPNGFYKYPYKTGQTAVKKARPQNPPDSLQTQNGQAVNVIASSGVELASGTEVQDVYKKANYTYGAGDYCDLAVTSDGTVIIAWYDSDADVLRYTWQTSAELATDISSATSNAERTENWEKHTNTIGTGGEYVKIAADKTGAVHFAYYDSTEGDLKYAYISALGASPVVSTVDSYSDTGEHVTLCIVQDGTAYIPYIGYYANKLAKVAYRVKSGDSANNGASGNFFTGNWYVSYVPSASLSISADTVNVGMYSKDGVITAIPTVSETTYANDTPGSNVPGNSSIVGGNGTKNPIAAYITTSGALEMAQMK